MIHCRRSPGSFAGSGPAARVITIRATFFSSWHYSSEYFLFLQVFTPQVAPPGDRKTRVVARRRPYYTTGKTGSCGRPSINGSIWAGKHSQKTILNVYL